MTPLADRTMDAADHTHERLAPLGSTLPDDRLTQPSGAAGGGAA